MTRRTRSLRVLTLAGALCVCIGAVAAGAGGAASSSSSSSAASSQSYVSPNISVPTSSSNKRAAVRDAVRLLGLAALPAGATRVSAEPGGDDKLLIKPPQEPTGRIVDRYGWWRVPAAFDSVVAFLRAHPPPGSARAGSGYAGGPTVPENQMLSFSFSPISGVVSMRALTFYAVALRGRGTGIRVDAQETWIVPRPASETIPAGVHEVDLMIARPAWRRSSPGASPVRPRYAASSR